MSKFDDVEALVASLVDATKTVAARIDALVAVVQDAGLSAAQEDQVVGELTALRDQLIALGQTPNA